MPLVTARISETVAPSRLGRSFRWLLASSFISNVGDGIALAAGPLLVASLTHDPFIVSMALLAQQLPNLLFGLPAGAIADRYDRRRIIAAVNLARAAVLAVLAATLVGGVVSIAVVLLTLFILGTAEIFADVSSNSLVPRVVPREHLGVANARLTGSFLLTNELLGPPIGAFLFTVGLGLPFAANAACFALGAVLVTRVATDVADLTAERTAERGSLRTEMADGIRWLVAAPADAHPRPDDHRLQRHVRGGLVGPRAVRERAPRDERCRLRAAHDGDCHRRHHRDVGVWQAGAPVLAR